MQLSLMCSAHLQKSRYSPLGAFYERIHMFARQEHLNTGQTAPRELRKIRAL